MHCGERVGYRKVPLARGKGAKIQQEDRRAGADRRWLCRSCGVVRSTFQNGTRFYLTIARALLDPPSKTAKFFLDYCPRTLNSQSLDFEIAPQRRKLAFPDGSVGRDGEMHLQALLGLEELLKGVRMAIPRLAIPLTKNQ